MKRTAVFTLATLSLALLLAMASVAEEGLPIGTEAPFFKVKSGDNKVLTLDMVKGKIVVLFYEHKDATEKNKKAKDELNNLYDEQPDTVQANIVRLAVIDCTEAFWPVSKIWRKRLRESSKRVTVYGDWDGKMKASYKMKEKESNAVLIDKKGIIRYFRSGKVNDEEISKIKELLRVLIYEE